MNNLDQRDQGDLGFGAPTPALAQCPVSNHFLKCPHPLGQGDMPHAFQVLGLTAAMPRGDIDPLLLSFLFTLSSHPIFLVPSILSSLERGPVGSTADLQRACCVPRPDASRNTVITSVFKPLFLSSVWNQRGLSRAFWLLFSFLLKAGGIPGYLHILSQARTGVAPAYAVPPPPRHPPWRVRMRSATPIVASSCSLVSVSGEIPLPRPPSPESPGPGAGQPEEAGEGGDRGMEPQGHLGFSSLEGFWPQVSVLSGTGSYNVQL